jgi:CheY-like chemotaxis protein
MARRQKTLLCVDDNRSSLNIFKIILEDFGYRVLAAKTGREGLEVFASNAIDAVILDYQMPEMNGELVAAEMKRTNPRVPILMLSGCGSLPQSALQFVDEFVAKGDPVEFHASSSSASVESSRKAKARKSRHRTAGYDSEARIV